jgi:uncharacterized phage protein (TIGR01671 family)
MREIKFRGKISEGRDKGKWVYGSLIIQDTCYIVPTGWNGYPEDAMDDVLPETAGQFTGFKDKYSKEIYEGDIAKIDKELFVVEYYKGCFQLSKQVSTGTFRMFLYKNIDDLEVVGNIYENPQLLKQIREN